MSSDSLQTVLVVDDAPENITLLSGILGEHYRVKVALNGEKALSIAQSDDPPDIILLVSSLLAQACRTDYLFRTSDLPLRRHRTSINPQLNQFVSKLRFAIT